MFKKIAIFGLAVFHCILNAQTSTVRLTGEPNNDGFVEYNNPNNYNSTASTLRVYSNGSSGSRERSLLKFDLSSVPAGADIVSANLVLAGVNHEVMNGGVGRLQLVQRVWNQGNANWSLTELIKDASQPFVELPSPSLPSENYTLNVKAMVQSMVNAPLANYGWLLYMSNESNLDETFFEFASSDNANPDLKPMLEIVYCEHMQVNVYTSPASSDTELDGAANVVVKGGVPPYSYSWSNSATSSEINNIQKGVYYVIVTDARGVSARLPAGVTTNCGTMGWSPSGGGISTSEKIVSDPTNIVIANSNFVGSNQIIAAVTGAQNNSTIIRNTLAFDLSTIPNNVQVTNAKVVLTSASNQQVSPFTVSLHRSTQLWNAQTITYNNQPTTGETVGDALSFAYSGQGTYEVDVTAHVQKMIAEGTSMQGWVIKLGDEGSNSFGKTAAFLGSNSLANPPQIIISLSMPNYACDDLLLNWNQENTFDENGNVIHVEKTYLDKMGRKTQALVKNASNEVYRTETFYDAYGRPAIKTMPAFTGNKLQFMVGFVRNYLGQTYNYTHFDEYFNKLNNPDALHIGVNNTLGNYYSDNNVYDAYQAKADNPYTRITYAADPSNAVRKNAAPGNAFKMGSGRESVVITMVSGDELKYFYNDNQAVNSYKAKRKTNDKLNCDQIVVNKKLFVTKEITVTPDNAELVVYKENGKVLVSCSSNISASERCSNFTAIESILSYNGTASAEIHLPDADKSSLSLPLPINGGNPSPAASVNYKIVDMLTDKLLVDGIDYTINQNRSVTFSTTFLAQYTGRSLFLRIAYAYTPAYLTSLGINVPADAKITYNLSYGHITRNSYDLAGQLRKTISPKGFNCSSNNNFDFYSMYTTYDYSHLGQVIATKSPDEGLVQTTYDKKGNARFKQNDKQKATNDFSYLNYDKHGRIIENGEVKYTNTSNSVYFQNYYGVATALQLFGNTQASNAIINQTDGLLSQNKSNKTEMSYVAPSLNSVDNMPAGYTNKSQYQRFRNGQKTWVRNTNSIIWFNHDKFDRPLKTVTQVLESDFSTYVTNLNDRFKTTEVAYNGFTGKTTSTNFQNGNVNENIRIQNYYDINLRSSYNTLKHGNNASLVTLNQNYYNKGGKVRRVVIGGGLQGVDYTYTLDGKLKAINHSALDATKDPGADAGNYADVFGEILEYYPADYERTGKPFANSLTTAGRYNGMIHGTRFKTRCMANNVDVASYLDYGGANINVVPNQNTELKFEYRYDEFNRLAHADFKTYNNANGLNTNLTSYGEHGVSGGAISYDKNGNILRLKREAHTGTLDDLSYGYSNGNTSVLNNQLTSVNDAALTYNNSQTNIYTGTGVNAPFTYNAIGQMTLSSIDFISNITYFPDGKIKKIVFANSHTLEYEYGADGSKIKSKYFQPSPAKTKFTWYVGPYTYEYDGYAQTPAFNLKHAIIPGAIIKPSNGTNLTTSSIVYELKDHLGNVRVTFQKNATNTGIEVLSWQDYYSFGGKLPGRDWIRSANDKYDFAFKGTESASDRTRWDHFPLREYNHDLGRFMAPDPYKQFHSPYMALGNNPINFVDPSGGFTINMPLTQAEYYRRKTYIDPVSWKAYVEALRDPEFGFMYSTGPLARFDFMVLTYDNFILYGQLKQNYDQAKQKEEDDYFTAMSERVYGKEQKMYSYMSNGKKKAAWGPPVLRVSKEEQKRRWYALNEPTSPPITVLHTDPNDVYGGGLPSSDMGPGGHSMRDRIDEANREGESQQMTDNAMADIANAVFGMGNYTSEDNLVASAGSGLIIQTNSALWDLDSDGKLSKFEADSWWIRGNGVAINVNNGNINWKGLVIPSGSRVGDIFAISTTDAFRKLPFETAATYGGTSFKVFSIRHVQVLDQKYHYNMRPNDSMENRIRNTLTEAGRPEGEGTDYMIHYYNSVFEIK